MGARILALVIVGAFFASIFGCNNEPVPPKVVPLESRTPLPKKR